MSAVMKKGAPVDVHVTNTAPARTQAVMKLTATVMLIARTAPPVWDGSIRASVIQRLPNTFGAYQTDPTTMLESIAASTDQ